MALPWAAAANHPPALRAALRKSPGRRTSEHHLVQTARAASVSIHIDRFASSRLSGAPSARVGAQRARALDGVVGHARSLAKLGAQITNIREAKLGRRRKPITTTKTLAR